MRISKTILTGIAIIMVATLSVSAEETKKSVDSVKPVTEPKVMKNQTHCPVMGGPIDSAAFTEIQGQRVYHCCPMCSEKLKADPDKYFKKAAEQGIIFENNQKSCPVSGKELGEKSIQTSFEGRRIYFCSEDCEKKFSADPKAHFEKMDAPPQTENKGHEGHTGSEVKESDTK